MKHSRARSLDWLRSFGVALQFLTQIPVRFKDYPKAQGIGRSLVFYPLIGALLGGLLATLALLLTGWLAPSVSAALLLCTWLWLTGALHMDGLADSADAWLGGHGDKARTLAIMKDPASGPIAVVVVVCTLLLKWTLLTELLLQQTYAALIVAPLLARTGLVALLLNTPYVRSGGIGEALVRHAPVALCTVSVLIALGLALYLSTWSALIAASLAFYLLRRAMLKRLQGLTGDTAGASVEVVEVVVLLAVLLLAS